MERRVLRAIVAGAVLAAPREAARQPGRRPNHPRRARRRARRPSTRAMAATTPRTSTRPASSRRSTTRYLPFAAGHPLGVRGRRAMASRSASRSRSLDETPRDRWASRPSSSGTPCTSTASSPRTPTTGSPRTRDGNVWYLGEDTHEYEDGEPVNADGAWEAGVDGALPGIVMPAEPDGRRRRSARSTTPAKPRTWARSSRSGVSRSIELGDYDDVVVMEHWTPLEPDVVEEKWYAAGVGVIYETDGDSEVELIEFTPPDLTSQAHVQDRWRTIDVRTREEEPWSDASRS